MKAWTKDEGIKVFITEYDGNSCLVLFSDTFANHISTCFIYALVISRIISLDCLRVAVKNDFGVNDVTYAARLIDFLINATNQTNATKNWCWASVIWDQNYWLRWYFLRPTCLEYWVISRFKVSLKESNISKIRWISLCKMTNRKECKMYLHFQDCSKHNFWHMDWSRAKIAKENLVAKT